MLWLIWHIWILVLLAFAGGVIVGWVLHGLSDETPTQLVTTTPEHPEIPTDSVNEGPGLSPARKVEPIVTPATHDDLTQINGLGPKTAERLNELGIHSFAQIAAWSEGDISRFDELTQARGRISRADWVGQAKALVP